MTSSSNAEVPFTVLVEGNIGAGKILIKIIAWEAIVGAAIYVAHTKRTVNLFFLFITSGKTTFLKHFEKFDDVCLVAEPVEKWRNLKWALKISMDTVVTICRVLVN